MCKTENVERGRFRQPERFAVLKLLAKQVARTCHLAFTLIYVGPATSMWRNEQATRQIRCVHHENELSGKKLPILLKAIVISIYAASV